jgi:hypothetical protein
MGPSTPSLFNDLIAMSLYILLALLLALSPPLTHSVAAIISFEPTLQPSSLCSSTLLPFSILFPLNLSYSATSSAFLVCFSRHCRRLFR